MRITRKGLAVAALCLLGSAANAHQDGEEDSEAATPVMDCEHPPADAVRKLPEPLSRWGRVSCFPSGQVLTQSSKAQWRYPSSYTTKVLLHARTEADDLDGRPRYFTQVSARRLEAAEARERHQELMKKISVYADRLASGGDQGAPEAPKAAWEIVGINNGNRSLRIYLMQHEGMQDVWGLVCAPECEPQMSFIVTPRE